jgi:ATP-dependent DNA ligase
VPERRKPLEPKTTGAVTPSGGKQLPRFIPPMLAKPGEPFDSEKHLFEIKWDGTRTLALGKGKDKGLAGKMEHGIKELKNKAHLEKASFQVRRDRGHAIKDIDHAIHQLHEAIAYVKKK